MRSLSMEPPLTSEIDDGKEFDEDFYENIEAPKFVDLTAPDPRLIDDDRYWFCHRVGCDQKHEDEMDSEAIYQNFVLRVMAARSPSVRLRKALCGKSSSEIPKCPLTVPAKSSKSRVSRLAMISSIPQKPIENAKPKSRRNIFTNTRTTPNAKPKHHSPVAAAKTLTTPRNNKRPVPNPGTFRSARNLGTETSLLRRDRVVGNALVFHSPKKGVKVKKSIEIKASVKKICAGMKKLEIANKTNDLGTTSHKSLLSDKSRKQLKVREVKSRVFDSPSFRNPNHEKLKSQKCLKKLVKEKKESKVGVDEKVSVSVAASTSNKDGGHDELSNEDKSEALPGNTMSAGQETKSSSVGREDPARTESSVNEISQIDDKENILTVNDNEDQDVGADDKENALASDGNRKLGTNHLYKRKDVCRKESCKSIPKVLKVVGKTLNGRSDVCSKGPPLAKCTKLKPTNPKPFRLRTDERRILKEANTEKKNLLAPAKETSIFLCCAGENSQPKKQISCKGKASKDSSTTPARDKSSKCLKTGLDKPSNTEERPRRIKPQVKNQAMISSRIGLDRKERIGGRKTTPSKQNVTIPKDATFQRAA